MPSSFFSAFANPSQMLCENYAKESVKSGIIHLGVGAFHRAHQAVYIDRLLGTGSTDWGITGVNIRPQDSQGFSKLQAQDGEYILKTMDAQGLTEYRHIRSIIGLIDGSKEPQAVDDAFASNATQLVTMTVTEGGYYLDEDGVLLRDHPAIAADLDKGERNTLYAYLRAGLKQRMENSGSRITLLCCDNLRHNGKVLQSGFKQFLQIAQEEALIAWLENNASFPCSMVDRITPRPDPAHAEDVQSRFGISDQMTVMAEDYIQWVVEDNFAGQRPDLSQVGVEMVENVEPYEEAKIRILNAGHTTVTYQAALKGLKTFDEAMRAPDLHEYLREFALQESIPAIGESVVNLPVYFDIVQKRFSNEHIGDTVERICTDGYAKFPIFVLPTLEGCYKNQIEPKKTLQAIASWFVFIQKVREGSSNTPYHEPNWDKLQAFTNDEQGLALFTSDTSLWGKVPATYPQFKQALTEQIHQFMAAS